jgi:hypothetical protein
MHRLLRTLHQLFTEAITAAIHTMTTRMAITILPMDIMTGTITTTTDVPGVTDQALLPGKI